MPAYPLGSTLLHVARLRLVDEYPAQIRECLTVLEDHEIWWRPNERANAIGNLVIHLCGSTGFYIGCCLGGAERARDRDSEFAERTPLSRSQLLERLEDLVSEVSRVLSAENPDALDTTTDRSGKTTSRAQLLLHAMLHTALHTGQILYATKLLKEGAIEELTLRTRQR